MKTRHPVRVLIVLAALVAIAPVRAQQSDRAASAASALNDQIDRIFSARAYETPRFGPARWLPDGTAYAIVEGSEIARYDAATGARTILVPAAKLVPSGTKTPIDIDDYAWS